MFKKESYFMTFDFNFNTNSICNLLWINFAITRRSCDSMQKMYIKLSHCILNWHYQLKEHNF